MTRVRERGENVRRFILEQVEKHPSDISRVTSDHFQISRQAVNVHLKKLMSENVLSESGKTRGRSYKLCPLVEWRGHYQIAPELAEDVAWRSDIVPVLGQLPENVMNIWH